MDRQYQIVKLSFERLSSETPSHEIERLLMVETYQSSFSTFIERMKMILEKKITELGGTVPSALIQSFLLDDRDRPSSLVENKRGTIMARSRITTLPHNLLSQLSNSNTGIIALLWDQVLSLSCSSNKFFDIIGSISPYVFEWRIMLSNVQKLLNEDKRVKKNPFSHVYDQQTSTFISSPILISSTNQQVSHLVHQQQQQQQQSQLPPNSVSSSSSSSSSSPHNNLLVDTQLSDLLDSATLNHHNNNSFNFEDLTSASVTSSVSTSSSSASLPINSTPPISFLNNNNLSHLNNSNIYSSSPTTSQSLLSSSLNSGGNGGGGAGGGGWQRVKPTAPPPQSSQPNVNNESISSSPTTSSTATTTTAQSQPQQQQQQQPPHLQQQQQFSQMYGNNFNQYPQFMPPPQGFPPHMYNPYLNYMYHGYNPYGFPPQSNQPMPPGPPMPSFYKVPPNMPHPQQPQSQQPPAPTPIPVTPLPNSTPATAPAAATNQSTTQQSATTPAATTQPSSVGVGIPKTTTAASSVTPTTTTSAAQPNSVPSTQQPANNNKSKQQQPQAQHTPNTNANNKPKQQPQVQPTPPPTTAAAAIAASTAIPLVATPITPLPTTTPSIPTVQQSTSQQNNVQPYQQRNQHHHQNQQQYKRRTNYQNNQQQQHQQTNVTSNNPHYHGQQQQQQQRFKKHYNQQPNQNKTTAKDLEEFDFEGSNSRFNKEKVVEEIAHTATSGNEDTTTVDASIEGITNGLASTSLSHHAYTPSNFFDTISCESLDKQSGESGKQKSMHEQRKIDQETFGISSVRSYDHRRGRGGARGGARTNQRYYNNNQQQQQQQQNKTYQKVDKAGNNSKYDQSARIAMNDLYDPISNPLGYIFFSISENRLCYDLLEPFLNVVPGLCQGLTNYTKLGEHLFVGPGASCLLEAMFFSICDENDWVICPSPLYSAFVSLAKVRANVKIVPVGMNFESKEGTFEFKINREELEKVWLKANQENAKISALLLCNPNNPTGTVYSYQELEDVVKFCRSKKIHLISDEIYALSVFGDEKQFTSIYQVVNGELNDDIHILSGFSKDFGLIVFSSSSTVQTTITQILNNQEFLDLFIQTNRKRLKESYNFTISLLNQYGIPFVKSDSGLFLLLDFRKTLKENSFNEEMRVWEKIFDDAKILINPGQSLLFDRPGYFRFIFSHNPSNVKVALERIGKVYNELIQ
eukprot:gene2169-2669_t